MMIETAEEQAEEGADNEQWTLQSRRTNKRKNNMELNKQGQDESSNNNNNSNDNGTEDVEMENNQLELTGLLRKSNYQARSHHQVSIIKELESGESG